MSDKFRKTCALILGGLALLACAVAAFSILKDYSTHVPLTVGPYKKALFAGLAAVMAAALGFYLRPLNGRTAAGTVFIGLAVLWFSGRMLLVCRMPESPRIDTLNRWMLIPLLLAAAGIALWAGEFISSSKPKPISERWLLTGALLVMFLCLLPALSGGFNWDDAFFSVEAQAMRVTGESIFARVWREIVEYVRIGRINPFATFHFLVFYFIPDAFAYKLLLVGLSLLNGFFFYRLLRLWEKDEQPALAALLIVPLCFQLRLYHDPLNSYYGLMQIMFCELMLALIWFIRWMREKRGKYLILSLIPFLMGLMSYEMFFPLTALFLIPAWDHEKNLFKAIRRVLPYVVTAVVLFGLSMILRTNITEETAYAGTTFSINAGEILRTLFCQVTAAFPLSYRLAGRDAAIFGELIQWPAIFNTSLTAFFRSISGSDLLACLVLILIVGFLLPERLRFSWKMLLFAILLWILPGLVISLSIKYQQDLQPGMAYIPVYFSYFGAALILYELLALFGKLFRPRTGKLLLCGIGCAALLIGMQDNRHISEMLNNIFLYPRQTGEAAIRAGILGDYDRLVVSNVPYSLWEHGWQMEPYQDKFYSLNAGHPVNAVGARDFAAPFLAAGESYAVSNNTALVTYSGDREHGFAKYALLRGGMVMEGSDRLTDALVTDVFFFVSGYDLSDAVLIYETKDAETKWLPLSEAWLIRETEDGALYKIQETRPVLFDTVGIFIR